MNNTTKVLLKNGINEMLSENGEYFKQNIEQALAVKLNDSINTVRQSVSQRLFDTETLTENNQDIQNFISFFENFREGKYSFKDGSVINITENEKDKVKDLFESLNPNNRTYMAQEIFQTITKFKQHVEFATKVRNLQ